MINRREVHYKNQDPSNTVDNICNILKKIQIEVTEEWMEQSSANTYSLRLWLNGMEIGSNGKGITKEYARASAYAELMERMQNRWMGKCYLKNGDLKEQKKYYIFPDEIKMSVSDVLKESNSFFDMLYSSCGLENTTIEEKKQFLNEIHRFESYITGKKEEWVMIPFYSVKEKKTVILPYFLYTCIYGSNGMCAGNTPKEAVVQGISEIIERYVQREILQHKYCIPDFPMNLLSNYPEIEKRMKLLNELKGYRFILKDCSFGGKYPVVALVSIEIDTGNFGIKFGCHPDIGIALERVITETSQGMDFNQYCRKSKLNFGDNIVGSPDNFSNVCHTGRGQYPFEMFCSTPDFPFVHCNKVQNVSDDEMFDYYINDVIESKNDVFIRDSSILGFPSFHVIIPKMSEMNHYDRKRFTDIALKQVVGELIVDPSLITEENVPYLQYVLQTFGTNDMQSSIKSLSGVLISSKDYPSEDLKVGWLYMLIACQIFQEKYTNAFSYITKLLSIIPETTIENKVKYHALKDYLHGRCNNLSHDECVKYLRQFYRDDICVWLDNNFVNPKEVFKKIYFKVIDNSRCLKENSDYYRYAEIMNKLDSAMMNDRINQICLNEIF